MLHFVLTQQCMWSRTFSWPPAVTVLPMTLGRHCGRGEPQVSNLPVFPRMLLWSQQTETPQFSVNKGGVIILTQRITWKLEPRNARNQRLESYQEQKQLLRAPQESEGAEGDLEVW